MDDPHLILAMLTADQKKCVRNLSDQWKTQGYSQVTADLLAATDSRTFPGRYDRLIEDDWSHSNLRGIKHRHRLTPLGMVVKQQLENES